ncbi:MAG: MHYT domain-containing protein [Noviherbaspirillum sp.]
MMSGNYEFSLILVSILVAIFASYTALGLAGRIRESQGRTARFWIVGGALAMGTGIWSMHFIGMLAFKLPIPVGYDFGITLLSLLLPILVSGIALWQISQSDLPTTRLLAGAILMGIGINAMHYTGMLAMRMEPGIRYDPPLFAASLLIAILASGAALWVAFRLRENVPRVWLLRAVAAVFMGSAIAGMHYTGMAAAHFLPGSVCLAASGGLSQETLATTIIIATLAILTVALLVSVYDARLESRSQILAMSQATAEERRIMLMAEREARAQAESTNAMKDEFLATLSHELRTPLNSILGWTQLLQSGIQDPATFRKGLDTIERNARAQAQLIEDLLDTSQIISGKVRLDMQRIDPITFITSALETIKPAAHDKELKLKTSLDPGAGPVSGDAGRLQQVMLNLLSNAVKFTPHGGTIQVTLERLHGEVVIRVIDSGIGIHPDFLRHVFDRFRQADASTTRRHGGLGLGLSIARHLAELQGGSVHAASPGEGKGATFTVQLPLHGSQPAAADQIPSDSSLAKAFAAPLAPTALTGVKALLVDDDADALDLMKRVLMDSGATVISATNASQGLMLVETEKPDVIVSDIGMPDVDGFELIRRIRKLGEAGGGHVPAMALTAFTRAEDQKRALQAGFTHYMPKPLEPTALVLNVAAMVGRLCDAAKEE